MNRKWKCTEFVDPNPVCSSPSDPKPILEYAVSLSRNLAPKSTIEGGKLVTFYEFEAVVFPTSYFLNLQRTIAKTFLGTK